MLKKLFIKRELKRTYLFDLLDLHDFYFPKVDFEDRDALTEDQIIKQLLANKKFVKGITWKHIFLAYKNR